MYLLVVRWELESGAVSKNKFLNNLVIIKLK